MSDLGEMLRSARQKKGLGLDDAAAATRIKEIYLTALEDGDYSLLPGPAYITGFLRNYGSYLGLHPDDVVQAYYAMRPVPQPGVKAATRVLASGYHRENRSRLFWILGMVVVVLAGAYAVKQYNDSTAHAYTPPVNVTASGLSGTVSPTPATKKVALKTLSVQLKALSLAWVRVQVDNRRVFQGNLRAHSQSPTWIGHRSVYVVSLDGAHIRVRFNGRSVGLLAGKPGLIVAEATASGWRRVA